jgi:heme/copper-type cytochrome/quinol oxidase subunit 3
VFFVNLFVSLRRGRAAARNAWSATTLEWAAPSPPPHGNFTSPVRVYRGPYEYSVPGAATDFTPQNESDRAEVLPQDRPHDGSRNETIPFTVVARPDTGTNNVTLGMWLFIASEVMLFGGLFSGYVLLRSGATDWPHRALDVTAGALNTLVLLASSATVVMSRRAAAAGRIARARLTLVTTAGLALVFLAVKAFEWWAETGRGVYPDTSTFYAVYFLLTGVHALHVVGGIIAMVWLASVAMALGAPRFANRSRAIALYWNFIDAVWLSIFVLLYLL